MRITQGAWGGGSEGGSPVVEHGEARVQGFWVTIFAIIILFFKVYAELPQTISI